MELFDQRLPLAGPDTAARLAAIEDQLEYLRQQGQYGLSQLGRRLDELEKK